MATHSDLIDRALKATGMTQQQFADAINAQKGNGSVVIQSTVSKWLQARNNLSPINAMAVHKVTNGEVSFFEFFEELADDLEIKKPKLKKKTRVSKPLRNRPEVVGQQDRAA